MATLTKNKNVVTLQESEIQDFLSRYPGLKRMDVLHAIVRAGPKRSAIDAAIGKLWNDRVLTRSPYH